MGGKQSTNTNSPRLAQPGNGGGHTSTTTSAGLGLFSGHHQRTGPSSTSGGAAGVSQDARQRARSLSSVLNGQPVGIPAGAHSAVFGVSGSPDSEDSTPDELPFGRVFAAHSLPVQLVSFNGIKCPVCSKFVLPDDVECHLVMCLTKPRISYNEDVLTEDKGECVICLDDLLTGNTIARLPCLCIYHKTCIDAWFEVNRSCPEHPLD